MASLRLKRELDALDRLVVRGLPEIDDTRRLLQSRARLKENLMTKVKNHVRTRPWLPPAAAVAAGLLLLLLPVSYHITSGYAVRLRLDVPGASREALGPLAAELGKALGTEHVAISTASRGLNPELLANVTSGDREAVENAARAFATGLSARGISSELALTPMHSVVSGNLYAMGLQSALRLDIRKQGRSGSDIERDIRDQLEASGVAQARVSYREQDGCSMVQIVVDGGAGASRRSSGDGIEVALICSSPEAACSVPCPPECRTACPTGDVDVTIDGQAGFVCSAQAGLESVAGMSDDQIARALQDQLKSRGVDAEIVVHGGRVMSVSPVCRTK
jgi:hypothetical protein